MLRAGHAQAASEQALGVLPTLESTAGTPKHPGKVWGGWWKGGFRCDSPEGASVFSKPARDADAQVSG